VIQERRKEIDQELETKEVKEKQDGPEESQFKSSIQEFTMNFKDMFFLSNVTYFHPICL
jgi:hypothetical protein